MDQSALLGELVRQQYGVRTLTLHPLSVGTERRIYKIEQPDIPPWVLRAYSEGYDTDRLLAHAAVLSLLERHNYPAARIVRRVDDTVVSRLGDRQVLMTTFMHGASVDYSPHSLRLLGTTVGHLHMLPVAPSAPALPVPAAHWRPAVQIPAALEQLAAIWDQVPLVHRVQYSALVVALHSMQGCEDLPVALIHTDCFPGNAIHLTTDTVALVDWDDAGLGPAVVDLGYLLITSDAGLSRAPKLRPDPVRITAVVDGYCQQRRLTPAEMAALPDMIRFGPAVNAAWTFADMVAGTGEEHEWQRWWGRYEAAEETAALAQERFEQNVRGTST